MPRCIKIKRQQWRSWNQRESPEGRRRSRGRLTRAARVSQLIRPINFTSARPRVGVYAAAFRSHLHSRHAIAAELHLGEASVTPLYFRRITMTRPADSATPTAEPRVEWLGSTCTVVGLFEPWHCDIAEAQLSPGDTLVLYTDGVTEAANADGRQRTTG